MVGRLKRKRVFLFWLFWGFLGIACCGLLILGILKLKKILTSDFKKLSRKNFVVYGGEKQVFVLSFQDKEGLILFFSPNQRVQVARGFGEYELGKVYKLGQLEGKGSELVRETFEVAFSIPVFGVFYEEGGVYFESVNPRKVFQKLFWLSLKGKIKTDLSRKDIFALLLQVGEIDKDKVKVAEFKNEVNGLFKDKKLRQEALAVEVLNSTQHSGLAQSWGDFLETAGCLVVRVGETSPDVKKCILELDESLSGSYTAFWLRKVLGCEERSLADKSERVKFRIILGEEEWKKGYERW